jgi:transposase
MDLAENFLSSGWDAAMTKPLSMDLRDRIVACVEDGASRREAADRYAVCASTAVRIIKRKELTGSAAPAKIGGYRRPILEPHLELLRAMVDETPDMTLEKIRDEVHARTGLKAGVATVDRMLKRIGLRFKKKSLIADEQTRDDVAVTRGFFRRIVQRFMDSTRFIFFDETVAKTNMTRLYGRALDGERLVASVPHGHWKTTTFVAGLSLDGVVAPAVFDSPMDGPSFLAYVEQLVVPCLRPGDVVLMDNLAVHKVAGVEAAIRSAGASIIFTPAYSPDFNPIEKFFSKLKSHLRALGARSRAALDDAIADVCATLTKEECQNFFISCGYGVV